MASVDEFVNDTVEFSVAFDTVLSSAPPNTNLPARRLILLFAQARTDPKASHAKIGEAAGLTVNSNTLSPLERAKQLVAGMARSEMDAYWLGAGMENFKT